MDLYSYAQTMTSHDIFSYSGILLIAYILSRFINIGLNTIFSLICAILIIIYLYQQKEANISNISTQYKLKGDMIRPPINETRKHNEIVDFIFSIQDIYQYCPAVFESMVNNIENFFRTYEDGILVPEKGDILFQSMMNSKTAVLNDLHSMIYSLPNNNDINNKMLNVADKADELLSVYTQEIYDKYQDYIISNGLDASHHIIMLGPKPYESNKMKQTYDFYI